MKKVLIYNFIILAIVIAIGVVGCKNNSNTEQENKSRETENKINIQNNSDSLSTYQDSIKRSVN